MLVEVIEGPPHDEQPWQDVDEDSPDPWRHRVGLRGPEMNVEYDDGHANTETLNQGTITEGEEGSVQLTSLY